MVVLNANAGVVAEKRLVGPPDLVVEIASPNTVAYDRDFDRVLPQITLLARRFFPRGA